jgi:hypothetical protein
MRSARTLLALAGLAVAVSGGPVTGAEGDTLTVSGKVTELKADRNELTVRTAAGKTLRLRVGDDAKLRLGGKPAKLKSFPKGTVVIVTYRPEEGTNRVVRLSGNPAGGADVRREVREALAAVTSYSFRQKEEYEKRLRRLMAELDERIADLRVRARAVGADLRKKYDEQVKDLRAKRAALRKRLEKVREASPDAWEDVKAGVGNALEELGKAFERARSRFKE